MRLLLQLEPFVVLMPKDHPLAAKDALQPDDLNDQQLLLLGEGHCFRDQVLEVCPEMARFSTPGNGMQRTFEGSSLETIRHMVASGIGLTVLPRASVADMKTTDGMLQFRHFEDPQPSRRVVILWRKSFTRKAAIDAVFPLEPVAPGYPGEVARRWRYRDGAGEIGVIASVTQPFCRDCTRARLTADGRSPWLRRAPLLEEREDRSPSVLSRSQRRPRSGGRIRAAGC